MDLNKYLDLSPEVAQVLKMREGTVRTRLVRARAMLREQRKGGEERA